MLFMHKMSGDSGSVFRFTALTAPILTFSNVAEIPQFSCKNEWPKKIYETGGFATTYENIEESPELVLFGDRYLRDKIWLFIFKYFRERMFEVYGNVVYNALPNLFAYDTDSGNELLYIYDFCTDIRVNLMLNGRKIIVYNDEPRTVNVMANPTSISFTFGMLANPPARCRGCLVDELRE